MTEMKKSNSGSVQSKEPEEVIGDYPGDIAEILIVDDGIRKIVPSKYGLIPPFIPQKGNRNHQSSTTAETTLCSVMMKKVD